MVAATLAAPVGQGTGLLDRPWPFSHSASAFAALPKREVPTRVLFFFWPLMSKSSSSSHAKWQGSTRWKQGRSGSWKGRDDSPATTSPVSEQVPDEHVTTALHTMQDHPETTVIFRRRSQKTFSEQSASKKKVRRCSPCPCTRKTRKGEAPLRAEVRGGVCGRDHLQRRHVADVLEKPVETVTMRAGAFSDHGGGLLQDDGRPPRTSAETLERASSAAEPAKHRFPSHTMKITRRRKKRSKKRQARAPLVSPRLCCLEYT